MKPARSITGRLRTGFVVFTLLLTLAIGSAVFGAVHQYQTIDNLTTSTEPLVIANVELREDFASSVGGLSGYLLAGQSSSLESYLDARLEFPDSLAMVWRLAPPSLRGNVAAQARASSDWYRLANETLARPLDDRAAVRLAAGSAASVRAFFATNSALQERVARQTAKLVSAGRRSLAVGLAVSGAVLFLAIALALIASVGTMRSITRPLRGLTAVLRDLAAGDHAARAEVAGAAEVREAALSVNALADQSDRLRREEQKHARLRAVARDAGNRIREHLLPGDVIREAHAVIEQELDCDMAFVQLVVDGRLGSPENYRRDSALPPDFLTEFPEDAMGWLVDLYVRGASMVIQDLRSAEGEAVPPVIRDPMLRLGIVAHIVTPFGIGAEILGIIAGERTRPGHPWSPAEIDAFQSIAADVGRGLNHARLYEAENHLVAELKALDRAKSDFLATVSHEFRTPLTSIAGYVELLRDAEAGPVNSAQDTMLDTIGRNAIRLRNLIEDLLTLSRMEAGSFKTVTQKVNLADIVSSAVMAIRPVAENAGLTLTSDATARFLIVDGDADQLDRVLMNLLANAVKFTPEGGHVDVSARGSGGTAAVTVRDTGIGIPEGDKKALFTRFFRASNVVERSIPGTGLGLTIVRTIITNHGGEMDLESREGHGTAVTVRIPLRPDDRPGSGSGQADSPGRDELQEQGPPRRP